MMNPFSCLPLDKEAIDIHSRYEVPGAAEYLLKDKDLDKKNRSKKTGTNTQGANTGLAQNSTANINKSTEPKAEASSKRQ